MRPWEWKWDWGESDNLYNAEYLALCRKVGEAYRRGRKFDINWDTELEERRYYHPHSDDIVGTSTTRP